MKYLLAFTALVWISGSAFAAGSPNYYDPIVSGTGSSSGGTPGGTTGQVQYNNAGSFGGFGLYNAASDTLSGLIGISTTGVISSSRIMTGDGSVSAPGYSFVLDPDTGRQRAGNNQMNDILAGAVVSRYAQTTLGIMTSSNTPSATFHVGTQCASGACVGSAYIAGSMMVNGGSQGVSTGLVGLGVSGSLGVTGPISTTTGYVHLGSPTTVPTCDATNKGNMFMNTTTNCLNYCDGTANRQVTSLDGSCT